MANSLLRLSSSSSSSSSSSATTISLSLPSTAAATALLTATSKTSTMCVFSLIYKFIIMSLCCSMVSGRRHSPLFVEEAGGGSRRNSKSDHTKLLIFVGGSDGLRHYLTALKHPVDFLSLRTVNESSGNFSLMEHSKFCIKDIITYYMNCLSRLLRKWPMATYAKIEILKVLFFVTINLKILLQQRIVIRKQRRSIVNRFI
uniref:Uncharacterized protein n=1 Tax=Glossina austeni TaxID=7395 RepID=A0A1A9VRT7_GLOAU